MSIFRSNRNLLIIALIAIVNALGYGIIIPILYSYSHQFGLTDFQNGLLFAIFSLFQFIATPIIGRMSDKYGRRPLLIISIAGTALSFFIMAFAPSAIFLFIARALDGITAGNIPVATAVISDTTKPEHRAKGFGIIGASFGFGFVFGPAISALTVGISPSLPFIIAGVISLIAVVITALYLPETNQHIGEVKKGKLFDFPKLYHALFDPNVGITLIITLIYYLGFFAFIYAFQPYLINVLRFSANQVSLLYTLFGVLGLVTQLLLVETLSKRYGLKHTFSYAILTVALGFVCIVLFRSVTMFVVAMVIIGIPNAIVGPLINTIISRETDDKSQGTMMGLNASYMSIGQILGPIVGGALTRIHVIYPFILSAALIFGCYLLSFKTLQPGVRKESAF